MAKNPLQVLSLEDLKYQLNEPQDDDTNDVALTEKIEDAVALVSDAYGASLVDRDRWLECGYLLEDGAVAIPLLGEILKSVKRLRIVPSDGVEATEEEIELSVDVEKLKSWKVDETTFYAVYPANIDYNPDTKPFDHWPEGFVSLLVTSGADPSIDGSLLPRTLKRAVILAVKDLWAGKEKLSPIVHQMIALHDPSLDDI